MQVHIKNLRFWNSNTNNIEEMEDIMKIIKSLEDSSLSLKGVSETIQNEAKEQKGGSLSMLLGTLGATLLGNMLAKIQGRGIIEQDMVLKIFNQKEME